MVQQKKQHHFLVVSIPAQSHINPALNLSRRLTGVGVHVTFSTAISAHRRMFPDNPNFPLDDQNDPLLSYSPYSDGYDDGFDLFKGNPEAYMSTILVTGRQTLHPIAASSPTRDKPAVTFLIHTLFLPWAEAVARDLGLPAAVFWIQPVEVFTIYYHYFHGYKEIITEHKNDPFFRLELPGLLPIEVRDLPSLLVQRSDSNTYAYILRLIGNMYDSLDEEISFGKGIKRPLLLVNSFKELESHALTELKKKIDIFPVGPFLPSTTKSTVNDIVKNNDPKDYMAWLEQWPEKSVIYLSFGSLSLLSKKQNQEFSSALVECGRPFLWVVRGDREGVEVDEAMIKGGKGMVVGWCSQVEVLSHSSIGCFVTHCGWNSTFESLVAGVPTVAFPQWTDQTTNARLVEGLWKTGVRMNVDQDDGVVKGMELKRCLDLLMREEDIGVEIRRNAQIWKEKAREAVVDGGSSQLNLLSFIGSIGFSK